MSKLFTIAMALLVAGAASFAGYVYYTGPTLSETVLPPSTGESGCPMCELAKKKRACCDGESSAKRLALTGASLDPFSSDCRATDGLVAVVPVPTTCPATAALIGGAIFVRSCKSEGGCCDIELAKPDNALTGLVGAAITLAEK